MGNKHIKAYVSKPIKTNIKPIKNEKSYIKPTESSFLIVLISNSARFSWIPGSEPIHLDLEKLFLLPDSMGNPKFYQKFKISEPEKS